MNALMVTVEQAAELTDTELVERFEEAATRNAESDCRDAVKVLRAELMRRLRGQGWRS